MNLLVEVASDALNEYAYDADLAGLHFDVRSQPEGIQVPGPELRGSAARTHSPLTGRHVASGARHSSRWTGTTTSWPCCSASSPRRWRRRPRTPRLPASPTSRTLYAG